MQRSARSTPTRRVLPVLWVLATGCVVPPAGNPDGGGGDLPNPIAPEWSVLVDRQTMRLTGGTSQELAFEVPEGTVSLTIAIEGDERDQYYVSQWQDATGFVLVGKDWLSASSNQSGLCISCKLRVSMNEAVGGASAPNSPAVELNPGSHAMRVGGLRQSGQGYIESNATVRVSIHAKRGVDGVLPDTGTLDLNLHFTGVNGWNADNAPGSTSFQRLLSGFFEIYAQAGISIGQVRYYDVPSEFRVIETVFGANSDLDRLFKTSADHPDDNAANLFFVDEISSDQGVILGIAGGIPGPARRQGTARSGVAIVGKRVSGVPGNPSSTAAHEAGHFLGLYHTSEYGFGRGQIHDQLDDTPKNDDSYLMYASGEGETLSEWQGRILRLSPWTTTIADAPQPEPVVDP